MQNVANFMFQFGPWGFIVGVAVMVAIFMAIAVYGAYRRTKALQELAETLGFQFSVYGDLDLIQRFPRFQVLMAGRSQRILNLLRGSTESTQVMLFDWTYVTGSGKHSQTHTMTIVAIESADLNLSPFLCRPENLLDWFGLTFDGRDINFEDRPVFSKKFHLHGNNESAVRKLFDLDVCEFFEQHDGIYVEGHKQWLIYYQSDRSVRPDKLQERFKDTFQLYVLLKEICSGSKSADDSSSAVSDQPGDEMSAESERQF